jgi:hypothetical protein
LGEAKGLQLLKIMGKLREYIHRLQTVTVDEQEQKLLEIIRINEDEALDRNISQLLEGKDSKGDELFPPYSARTVEYKKTRNQTYDRVTLRDEGFFHQSFFMEVEKFPVVFSARDSKTDDLMKKYGGDIFGLDKKNLSEMVQFYYLIAYGEWLRQRLLFV